MLNLKSNNDINNLMVGGTFRLKVNLPMVPPYIKGEDFDVKVGINPNFFYLCVVKLDPNCNIISNNGSCLNLYIDNKDCKNKKLGITSQYSPYRLILVPEIYAMATGFPFLANIDFTLLNVDNNLHIKNVATGYYPSLFQDNSSINVFGNMLNDNNSNVTKIPELIYNNVCNESSAQIDLNSTSLNVNCLIVPDSKMYLMTSADLSRSSPLDIKINNDVDNTISISLKTFSTYGFLDNSYSLIFGDFDIFTFKDIEKITIKNAGTFFVNLVCFDSNSNGKLVNTNKLKFNVELVSLPTSFYNKTSVISNI
jgi:hypothetical protein